MTLRKPCQTRLHDPAKIRSVPLAGGGMTLQIGWRHDPAKTASKWRHEAANWQLHKIVRTARANHVFATPLLALDAMYPRTVPAAQEEREHGARRSVAGRGPDDARIAAGPGRRAQRTRDGPELSRSAGTCPGAGRDGVPDRCSRDFAGESAWHELRIRRRHAVSRGSSSLSAVFRACAHGKPAAARGGPPWGLSRRSPRARANARSGFGLLRSARSTGKRFRGAH